MSSTPVLLATRWTDLSQWEIKIDPSTSSGYFEWVGGDNEDPEFAGGLWFVGRALVDYDGVFELPSIVLDELARRGYDVEDMR